jgi:NADPH-dependent 2,4-dienoyl-CoA reductase/sulfur reductase-like enzyme
MAEEFRYRYLLIGGGMASDSAARGIRERDISGSIGLIGAEADAPVSRPDLSKALWTDPEFTFDKVWLNTAEDTRAELHLGTRAVALDRVAKRVETDSGDVYHYEKLLLATGSAPTRIDLPDDDRVIYFRTVEDYRRLRRWAGGDRRVAVIGGGFIATEIAAALAQNETAVTLIFPDELLGGSVFPSDLARHLELLYRAAGVELIGRSRIERGYATDDEILIELPDGRVIGADAVVLGLGVTPEIALARAAGLSVGDGVIVDQMLQTSDPSIWAAGDIAAYPDAILGQVRIAHVDNATEMGRQAGRNLAGAAEPYDHTPLFYSDLFTEGYEAVGRLDSRLALIEDWQGAEAGGSVWSGVVYYWDGDRSAAGAPTPDSDSSSTGRPLAGVLLWNRDGGTDQARELIAAPPADPGALRGRIR